MDNDREMEIDFKSHLVDEIHHFAGKMGLSKREKQVFEQIVCNEVSAEGISQALKISPNTATNHLKSIFDKTGVNSKSEVILLFLKQIVTHSATQKLFSRKPRILIVDDEALLLEPMVDGLSYHGCSVKSETDPTKVLDRLHEEQFDFIISDVKMPKLDGFQLLLQVRQRFPHFPLMFFMTGYSQYSEEQCFDKGAVGFFNKPFDIDSVFHRLMTHYIESPTEKCRFFRAPANIGIEIENHKLKIGDIGFGGLFIRIDDPEFWKTSNVKKGADLAISFTLEGQQKPVSAVCEVVWTNDVKSGINQTGMGVQFKSINKEDRDSIQEFVRLNKIKSYLPIKKKPS